MNDPAMIGESAPATERAQAEKPVARPEPAPEFGGRDGLEPTRYGDWEKNGRCVDF
ncbi:DUF1674 domain-containing protein [Luteimonas sp. RD2P54]|uniref:DUF1674 domain-containing protein n=1 Tax=Luteimonas endophytica TaxID=3042023 RepID=A0ABT6JC34_9GAMM|nr:DUF1674 domain-containing protein [Luteimonas endophytica]MDH5824369.1 DUF1674 domain-containing protein [Luteimonas endophytica]